MLLPLFYRDCSGFCVISKAYTRTNSGMPIWVLRRGRKWYPLSLHCLILRYLCFSAFNEQNLTKHICLASWHPSQSSPLRDRRYPGHEMSTGASVTSQGTSGATYRRTSLADIQLGCGMDTTTLSEQWQADQAVHRYCLQAMREGHAYLAATDIERYAAIVLRKRKEWKPERAPPIRRLTINWSSSDKQE